MSETFVHDRRLRLIRLTGALLCASFFVFCSSNKAALPKVSPPVAKVVSKSNVFHGETLIDNYGWLRDKENPEVIAYLKAENEYAEKMMKHTEKLQEKLYGEMLGRIKETDLSLPEKIDDYYYYNRWEAGKQYAIYCRKKDNLNAPEEILLDQNQLAGGQGYFGLGTFRTSPDHKLLAYSIDNNGSETYTLYVKDLATGNLLQDQIPNTSYGTVWANNNKTLFYTTLDSAKRAYRVYRHQLGKNPAEDDLVFEEKDEAFSVSIYKSRSHAYLFLESSSSTSSEIQFLSADHPHGEFEMIHPRHKEMLYSVEHHLTHFFILTNEKAKNFKLIQTSVTDPTHENWTEIIPHRDQVMIESIDAFENYLVIFERENGLKKIRIRDLSKETEHYVDFPEPLYTIFPTSNSEFKKNTLRFSYNSFLTPSSIYDYDMEKKTRELKKKEEVLGGFNPDLYKMERIYATAADGVKVPISLVYKKDLILNGKNPVHLHGYGSYGATSEPYFSSVRFSLIDRGFIYALAHIRGGGDLGWNWYEQGKVLNKKNTFTDFIACAEHLIAQNYTSAGNIAMSGGSAGGLLMGAVVNMRPELFKAVVAYVPYVDVINSMSDPTIPLVVGEYEEWGNPANRADYDYMKSYSPYDNVKAQPYPPMLITAGLNDPRVGFWEPAKWAAKLRATKTDQNLLLLKTNLNAGHSGSSGFYEGLKEDAFAYAFILDAFGMKS